MLESLVVGLVFAVFVQEAERTQVVPEPATDQAARMAQLAALANDPHADSTARQRAFHELREFGTPAIEAVRPTFENPDDPLQDLAQSIYVALRVDAGIQSRRDFYVALIEQHPFDAKVRGWLMRAEQLNDVDRPDPLVQKVKQQWRARLAETPDGELAFQLAGLLEDQLHGNELGHGSNRLNHPREHSGENFATLAQALRLARDHSEKLSLTWIRATRALAKLALLTGDWNGMNAELALLGEPPVPEERRPWLAPPPKNWSNLAEHWQSCDPKMRSGDCAFELKVEKDGCGVRGAHVRVFEAPPPPNVLSTGIDRNTLFDDPMPIGRGDWNVAPGFGYSADDRELNRYAVTGDDGVARFEGLPPIEIRVEVLIPTANFAEDFPRWDRYVKQADGSLELDPWPGGKGCQLVSGTTVQGPHLVLAPRYSWNLVDGQSISAPDFVLMWPATPETKTSGPIRYEVELSLGFPPGKTLLMGADSMPRLATTTVETSANTWPLAEQGVGELQLVPGNVYLVQVSARDAKGQVLARCGRNWCHVPWSHRTSTAPIAFDPRNPRIRFESLAPIDVQCHSTIADIDRFTSEHPDAFELEYLRVARAFRSWQTGDSAAARAILDELARTLPPGNVAAATGRSLLRRIDAGNGPGSNWFEFVAD